MAEPTSEEIQREKATLEKEVWGGTTLFANRFQVQTYGGAGYRLSFAEQWSSDLDVPPTFRAAIYVHAVVAQQIAQQIVNFLPPGSVTLPPVSPLTGLGGRGLSN